MPLLKNAKKALRVSKRKAALNQPLRSRLKSALDSLKRKPSAEGLSTAFTAIDKASRGRVIHWKKASRLKSQASKLVK